mgnify:CR=1 FL=1
MMGCFASKTTMIRQFKFDHVIISLSIQNSESSLYLWRPVNLARLVFIALYLTALILFITYYL